MPVNKKICFIYIGDIEGRSVEHVSGAGRLVNLAELAALAGWDVTMVGTVNGAAEEGEIRLRGLRCFKLFLPPASSKLTSFREDGKAFTAKLAPLLAELKISQICFYGTTLKYAVPLAALAKEQNLTLISSVNEWGHFSAQPLPTYLLQRLGIRYVRRKFDKVIAISTLMEEFYWRRADLAVVRIPTIFSREEFQMTTLDRLRDGAGEGGTVEDEKIRLVFAGAIGGQKDYVSSMISGLALLPPAIRGRFELWLAGSSEAQVTELMKSLGRTDDLLQVRPCMTFYGFLPREEVRKLMTQADFSVLLRPSEPYANAAFPTKFGESMFLGLPILANLTSDLGLYLVDGFNGYIVENETPEAFRVTLERVASSYVYPNAQMKKNALQTAMENFDLASYRDVFAKFLGSSS